MAAKLLSGSNTQQLRNLLDFAEGKALPAPTQTAKSFASRNDAAVAEMAVKPPSMIVFDPNSQFTRAISLEKSDLSPSLVQSMAALQRSLAPPR